MLWKFCFSYIQCPKLIDLELFYLKIHQMQLTKCCLFQLPFPIPKSRDLVGITDCNLNCAGGGLRPPLNWGFSLKLRYFYQGNIVNPFAGKDSFSRRRLFHLPPNIPFDLCCNSVWNVSKRNFFQCQCHNVLSGRKSAMDLCPEVIPSN